MSALWTPGRAGARVRGSYGRARRLRHGSSCTAPLPAVYAGSRWSWLDAGSALSLASSRPAPRGLGSTGQGLCVLHEGPTYPKYPQPSTSSTPPSCSASRQGRQRHSDRVSPSGRLKQQLSRPAGAPTPSLSPRSYLMPRARGLRVRPRDLTYDRGRWGGAPGVGCRRGAPAGRDPCRHLEPTRLKAYSRLPRTGAWPGRRPG